MVLLLHVRLVCGCVRFLVLFWFVLSVGRLWLVFAVAGLFVLLNLAIGRLLVYCWLLVRLGVCLGLFVTVHFVVDVLMGMLVLVVVFVFMFVKKSPLKVSTTK